MKNKKIKIEGIEIKPYKLTPKLLEQLKKELIEKKKLVEFHKSWIIQLTPDIKEIESIIMNGGLTEKMISELK